MDLTLDNFFVEGYLTDRLTQDDLKEIYNSKHIIELDKILYNININISLIKLEPLITSNINFINRSMNKEGHTILHQIISLDKYDYILMLLKYGANPQITDINGQTALHRTAYCTDIRIVSILIKYGAKLDHQDKNGNTSLHIASLLKNINIKNKLIELGADINATNNVNMIPSNY